MCGNHRSKEEEWEEEEITSFIYMRKNAKIQIGNFVILIDRQADTEESPKLSSIVIGGHTQQSKLPIAGSIDRLINGLKTKDSQERCQRNAKRCFYDDISFRCCLIA